MNITISRCTRHCVHSIKRTFVILLRELLTIFVLLLITAKKETAEEQKESPSKEESQTSDESSSVSNSQPSAESTDAQSADENKDIDSAKSANQNKSLQDKQQQTQSLNNGEESVAPSTEKIDHTEDTPHDPRVVAVGKDEYVFCTSTGKPSSTTGAAAIDASSEHMNQHTKDLKEQAETPSGVTDVPKMNEHYEDSSRDQELSRDQDALRDQDSSCDQDSSPEQDSSHDQESPRDQESLRDQKSLRDQDLSHDQESSRDQDSSFDDKNSEATRTDNSKSGQLTNDPSLVNEQNTRSTEHSSDEDSKDRT